MSAPTTISAHPAGSRYPSSATAATDNPLPGVHQVAEVPLVSVVPAEVREALGDPDYREVLDDEVAARALLERLEVTGGTPSQRHRAYDARQVAWQGLSRARLHTALGLRRDAPLPYLAAPVPEGVHRVHPGPGGAQAWVEAQVDTVGAADLGDLARVSGHGERDYLAARQRHLRPSAVQDGRGVLASVDLLWAPHLVVAASQVMGCEVFTDPALYSDGDRHGVLSGFTVQDGRVDVVVQVHAGDDPQEWQAGCPAQHVLAALHQVDLFGARHAVVVANVNDERLVVFTVTPHATVPAGPDTPKRMGQVVSLGSATERASWLVGKWSRERRDERATGVRSRTRQHFTLSAREHALWQRGLVEGFVFVDLETTTLTPQTGHVIEFGAVDEDARMLERLYGVPRDHLEWNGTGSQEVHQISPQMVEGLTPLVDDPAAVREIREFIGDRVVVAHHASFEESWLADVGVPVVCVDTVRAFGALVGDEEGPVDNAMPSLAAWAGVPYEGAHRALADARMLRESFFPLRKRVKEWVEGSEA